ncbi:hypothetical protein, partial [Kitasatospora aureofaciens]|uniref:hypothetical protein n=1 Tax=Kitasatospora aureofaciens TaxID=1894 RepID=UPI00131B22D3
MATRKAVALAAARQRARELQVRFQEREQLLLGAAEEFLAGQEQSAKAVEEIGGRIARLERERESQQRAGWERGAVVAARMRSLGAREGE